MVERPIKKSERQATPAPVEAGDVVTQVSGSQSSEVSSPSFEGRRTDRPIRKEDRPAPSQEDRPAPSQEDRSVMSQDDRSVTSQEDRPARTQTERPARKEDRARDDRGRDDRGRDDRGRDDRGKGRGKRGDREEPRQAVNPALMRGPKPVMPKVVEPQPEPADLEATEAVVATVEETPVEV